MRMVVDPEVIRTEPHTEVGALVLRNVETIIERWSQQAAAEQPNAPRVHHGVLLDHLPDLLRKLAGSLQESDEPQTCGHCRAAALHGQQRWEVRWSLPEVVRDYQILRVVLVDFLDDELDRPLSNREVQAIGLALDEAIAASVEQY